MIETVVEKRSVSKTDEKAKLDVNKNDKNEVVWKTELIWSYIIYYSAIHIGALYGVYRFFFCNVSWLTVIFTYIYAVFTGFGITAGAHRLWSHKSYKARLPYRIFLALCYTATGQRSLLEWCIIHRVHHKYSDTDADPHNSNRGFFFSHIGWVLIKPHPECIEKTARMYKDDLEADPVVYWQQKLYHPLLVLLCFVVPTLIPVYMWHENLYNAFFVSGMIRATVVAHVTFTVNSLAHMFGSKEYDVHIRACQNPLVTALTIGEGFHNYHHTFPRDYAACEFSNDRANKTTKFIDFAARLGLVYDRIKVDPEMIEKRRMRTGDLSASKKNTDADADDLLELAQKDY